MAVTLQAHQSFLHDVLKRQKARRLKVDPNHQFPAQPRLSSSSPDQDEGARSGQPSKANVVNYVAEEETIRNDYTTWYGVSGQVGANYILGAGDDEICEEYPALRRLMDLKAALVESRSHPPIYLSLPQLDSSDLNAQSAALTSALSPHRFDVILVHPQGSWSETSALPIRALSADPGFVFLWVGRGEDDGLERGRECLAKWGFRRAEDIVWVKTNRNHNREVLPKQKDSSANDTLDVSSSHEGGGRRVASLAGNEGVGGGGLLASQKEHCLMGIRGTVRRSTDTRFVHCNVDTDVMIWENDQDVNGPNYPPYLHTLVESFCLGTRRLQLFASPGSCRRGWVTVSREELPAGFSIPSTSRPTAPSSTQPDLSLESQLSHKMMGSQEVLKFDTASYAAMMADKPDGRDVLPYHPEIDQLRPKSPQRRGRGPPNQQGPPTGGFGGAGGSGSATSPPPTMPRGGGSGFRGGPGRGRGGVRGNMHQQNMGPNQLGQFGQMGGQMQMGQQPIMGHGYTQNMSYNQEQFGNPPMPGNQYHQQQQSFTGQQGGMPFDSSMQFIQPGMGIDMPYPGMGMAGGMQMPMYPQMGMGMGIGQGFQGMNPQMMFMMQQAQAQAQQAGMTVGMTMKQGGWQQDPGSGTGVHGPMDQNQGGRGGPNQGHGWGPGWYGE